MSTFKVSSTESLIRETLSLEYFHPNDDGVVPIPAKYVPGEGKLVVAIGGNASGKSFFRRVIQGVCSLTKIECMHLSMEGRRSVAYNPQLIFVYGAEDYQSTGEISSRTVTTAIRSSKDRESKHLIFWDEPDIGLSDDWSASMGAAIRDFGAEAPAKLIAAVTVTHSKPLLQQLVSAKPHTVIFGEDSPDSLEEYLSRPPRVRSLEDLSEESHRRFKLIQPIINERKAKR